jgi:DNA ligase-1
VRRLASALDRARACRSRTGKEEAIAAALRRIAEDGDDVALATAARMAAGRILPVGDGRSLGVGWSIVLDVVRAATGHADEVIFACSRKTGDLGEAFGLLLRRVEGSGTREGLPLREIATLGDALASEPGRAAKRALLERAFARTTPIEAKYLCKALGGGLRIGAQEGVVDGAVARAFGVSAESLRRATSLLTDPGELAVLAHAGRLDDAHLVVGRPVAFMLATPIETLSSPIDPASYVLEDKIDGVRAQAHKTGDGTVALFARGLDRVTDAFPEVVEALAAAAGPVVLDGELVAVGAEGRPRPFQSLQARLKKNRPTAGDLSEVRVALVAFDLLADGEGPLLDRPLLERRARLADFVTSLGPTDSVVLNPAWSLPPNEPLDQALDSAFAAARTRGHEGLVLKRATSLYEGGKRGQAWVKVKRANATLDVVVVAAEEGHGRRAGALSDYTFAVWQGGELVPVGKAYSGLTDDEIDSLTRRLEAITFERREGLRLVRPEIVLEVAFDGVQKSSRHASGFALRFPRIVRLRDDKRPEQADSIAAVEAIFASQVASGHREPGAASQKRAKTNDGRPRRRRARAKPSRQLTLFGEDD